MADVVRGDAFATDFHYAFWPAGRHVLAGTSPYPSVVDFGQIPFVYPMPAAVLLTPFALIPEPAADVLFTLLLGVAVVSALRLCQVRDCRCYGVALLWAPVFAGLQTANITLLLTLGLALLWRVRDRTFAAAAVTAILIAVKIFVWPILVWLAIRRGFRCGLWSVLLTVAITIASWSVIGFAGFGEYPHLVRLVERLEGPRSYSLVALGLNFGLGHSAAMALGLVAGGLVLAAVVRFARHDAEGRRSFALAVAAVILCSPVVWLHYFALLLVPFALLRPRFGPLWLLPLLLWLCPVAPSSVSWWPLAPLLVFGIVLGSSIGWRRPSERAPQLAFSSELRGR